MREENEQQSDKNSSRPDSLSNNLQEHTFYFDEGKIRYTNTSIKNTILENGGPTDFNVTNYTCIQGDNKLIKMI